MRMRAEQKAATRNKIIRAAIESFSAHGFNGASTRGIARQAGVGQGLLTYHFNTKTELWRAAADWLFSAIQRDLREHLAKQDSEDPKSLARAIIRQYVSFVAVHPELLSFMVIEGKKPSSRMDWLVETYIKPLYEEFSQTVVSFPPDLMPHVFYLLAGGASLIFNVPYECRIVTGLNPRTKSAIEAHADFIAQLLIP